MIKENEQKVKETQKIIDQKRPVRDRLERSIATLMDILTEHGAERYVKEFFITNIEQVSNLFRLIHAPQEFDKIVWYEDGEKGIRAVRKHDSETCRVSNLSSGQRNALSLSIFLTMNRKVRKGPQIIILDDPVAHLDDLNIVSFFDYLRIFLTGYSQQIFFATASAKSANLFQKKFDYLGPDNYREFELSL